MLLIKQMREGCGRSRFRSNFSLLAVASAAVLACGAEKDAGAPASGSSGTGGASSLSSGGSSGGSVSSSGAATGGIVSSGGSTNGGGTQTGGTPSATGGASQGGMSGAGSAGMAGAAMGGAATGGAAAAGATSGGASGAGAGDGGAGQGGAAGSAGSSGLPSVAELFPATGPDGALDGRLVTMPCADNSTAEDCVTQGAYYRGKRIDCAGGALDVLHTYPVAGTSGKVYGVTLHFYGIVEAKNYGNGVMREASARPGTQDSGSMPTPWATAAAGHTYPASTYNTYEIRVDDDKGHEAGVYYLNADTSEGHWTYVLNYSKQISVIGGGKVRVRTYDQNCKQIKNCGNPNKYPCEAKANSRVIDVSSVMPAPAKESATMGGLLQPALISDRDANNAGQWLLIDVVSVDSVK